jgi:hypothetical protein
MIRHLAKLCLGHVFGQLSGIANLARLRGTDGSALFIILIAVLLFAALTYAITSSSRSKGDVNKERTQLEASRMVSYVGALRNTVHRMVLAQGIPAETLMYNNNLYKTNNGNLVYPLGAPADPSRYVFHPSGGNLTPQNFPSISAVCTNSSCDSGGQILAGDAIVLWVQADGVGTDAPDIAIMFNNPTRDACIAFNKGFNMPVASGTFGLYIHKTGYQTTAAVNAEPVLTPMTAGAAIAAGRMEYCFTDVNSSGTGHANTGYRALAILFAR